MEVGRIFTITSKTRREGRVLATQGNYRAAIDLFLGSVGLPRAGMNGPSSFIAGLTRIGKTLTADNLAHAGYSIVPMDYFRTFFYSPSARYSLVDDAQQCRELFYSRLKNAGKDIVVEGADVLFYLESGGAFPPRNQVFLLGISEQNKALKAMQLLKSARDGHCRYNMDEERAHTISASISRKSRWMERLACGNAHYHFIDMMAESDDVVASARSAAERIRALLSMAHGEVQPRR